MMKKWIKFILLTVIEIPIITYMPYKLGVVVQPSYTMFGQWVVGAMFIVFGGCVLLLFHWGLYGLIKLNLKWAKTMKMKGD